MLQDEAFRLEHEQMYVGTDDGFRPQFAVSGAEGVGAQSLMSSRQMFWLIE